MEQKNIPELMKSRALHDADLLRGGAEFEQGKNGNYYLKVSDDQLENASSGELRFSPEEVRQLKLREQRIIDLVRLFNDKGIIIVGKVNKSYEDKNDYKSSRIFEVTSIIGWGVDGAGAADQRNIEDIVTFKMDMKGNYEISSKRGKDYHKMASDRSVRLPVFSELEAS